MRLACVFLLACVMAAHAATNTAASLDRADVASAIASASSGDTILLPAGSNSWTTGVIVNKGLTLIGAGNVWLTNAISTSQAIMFDIAPSTNQIARVTGINVTSARSEYSSYILRLYGSYGSVVRVDHCTFRDSSQAVILAAAQSKGVIDHCIFEDVDLAVNYGSTAGQATSWATPIELGTTNALYLEDNQFRYVAWFPYETIYTVLHDYGARTVWRNNKWSNWLANAVSPIIDLHGNVNGTNTYRGTRSVEFYNNTFWSSGSSPTIRIFDNRGGTLVNWGNTFIGTRFPTTFQAREEDGQDMGWGYVLTNYPGYDQHWIYHGTNTVNGAAVTTASTYYGTDSTFIIENTNLFWSLPELYEPLTYPHPLITVQDGAATTQSRIHGTMNVETMIIRGTTP